jgi:glycosyltransferase involved in cell wall biosynthesis
MGQTPPARVVHLTSAHPADDVRIFLKECRTLAAAGYDVRLIAPGAQAAVKDGVQIVPVPASKGRLARFTTTLAAVFFSALRQRAAVYHFHDPELMVVGIALKLCGKRVVYDVHESYREATKDKEWIPAPLRWLLAKGTGLFEDCAAMTFDAIVSATPHIAGMFPRRMTFTVCNYPFLSELSAASHRPMADRDPDFAYIGTITRARGILEIIEAVGITRRQDIRLHVAGAPPDEQLGSELAGIAGWSRTVSHGWLSRAQVAELCRNVRGGLVILRPLPRYMDALPIKLFEYMSAGLPVIASDFLLWRSIVDGAKCGLLVDPLSPADIARALDWIAENPDEAAEMGRRGRQAVVEVYNWEQEAAKLLACYAKLLS